MNKIVRNMSIYQLSIKYNAFGDCKLSLVYATSIVEVNWPYWKALIKKLINYRLLNHWMLVIKDF